VVAQEPSWREERDVRRGLARVTYGVRRRRRMVESIVKSILKI
jgi:hypothetical protein